MTAAEDTGHIAGTVLAVVFALVFLVGPGGLIIADEYRLRRVRRNDGVIVPIDRGTLAFGVLMLASGAAVIVVRILS